MKTTYDTVCLSRSFKWPHSSWGKNEIISSGDVFSKLFVVFRCRIWEVHCKGRNVSTFFFYLSKKCCVRKMWSWDIKFCFIGFFQGKAPWIPARNFTNLKILNGKLKNLNEFSSPASKNIFFILVINWSALPEAHFASFLNLSPPKAFVTQISNFFVSSHQLVVLV